MTAARQDLLDTLLHWMRERGLSHLRFRDGHQSIALTLDDAIAAPEPLAIASPVAGDVLLHHAVQPVPLVRAGDRVDAGQVLALLAQGPLYVAVRAPRAGTLRRILARHGAAVAAGEPLMLLA